MLRLNMIFEKWETGFDTQKLSAHIEKYVLPLASINQSEAFGGWSVLSSDGSYKDGWQVGHKYLKANMSPEELKSQRIAAGLKEIAEYNKPTEICHGYLQAILDSILLKGLKLARARIIRLAPHLASAWHRDCPDEVFSVRLHVPIITNPGCFFETETDRAHLPADGSSYFIRVNRIHRVVNNGDTPRFHLVMDVKDLVEFSTHHRHRDDAGREL